MGISRVNDAILALPTIMLGLIVIAAFGSSIPVLVLERRRLSMRPACFASPGHLGQDIMVQDFVEAAHARGEGVWWIIKSEVLPNAAMPLATDFGLRLVFVVLFISSLSFLGLGVQPPAADWGSMVRENLQGLTYGSYAAIWPALAIASFTIAINLDRRRYFCQIRRQSRQENGVETMGHNNMEREKLFEVKDLRISATNDEGVEIPDRQRRLLRCPQGRSGRIDRRIRFRQDHHFAGVTRLYQTWDSILPVAKRCCMVKMCCPWHLCVNVKYAALMSPTSRKAPRQPSTRRSPSVNR